jgi:hypothetical protein
MLSGDFVIGLMTIITGLAIADMVSSTHGLLMARQRVRWDWLATLAATYIFLLIVSSWGISYRTMGNKMINPYLWLFVIGLTQIIPLYLAARASLPGAVPEQGVSLADHYAQICRYFWTSVAFTYVIYLSYAVYTARLSDFTHGYWSPSVQLLLMLVLIAVCRRRVHALLVPLVFLLFCYDHVDRPMFG